MVLFISKKKKVTIFPSSVPHVQNKCRKNTKYICEKGNTDMDVYRAAVTFLISIGEMDFFFFSIIIILCCIIGYCVISVSKGSNKSWNRHYSSDNNRTKQNL